MTVELLVRVRVAGPEVPMTLEEEKRIEAAAMESVSSVLGLGQGEFQLLGVEVADEAWADLNLHKANDAAI